MAAFALLALIFLQMNSLTSVREEGSSSAPSDSVRNRWSLQVD
jgi:hypothetical protein